MKIGLERYQEADQGKVEHSEDELGVTFSEEYRRFVSKYDGATPEENVFQDDAAVSVDRFIPVGDIPQRVATIEGFPQDAWPIAESPGGNFVYMKNDDPSVYYWDHEIEADDMRLASSFEDFIDGLNPFDIDSIQLQPGQVKSVWVDPDFKPEF